jgi:acetylornithine deacetylase/succinyl-diaminopimelate desuccinylase-like protein
MQKLSKLLKSPRVQALLAVCAAFLAAAGDLGVSGLVALAGMAKAIESQGITIQISVGNSPSSFSTIANVTGFKGPGGTASVIDVSNLSSVAKEKLMGLPDEGQFTLDLNFDPDATTHQALQSARAARTPCEFKINFTDVTPRTAVFAGYVLGFEINGQVDQQVKAAVTIEIDGAVAWV